MSDRHEETPQIGKNVKGVLAIALAIVVVADFFIHKHHVYFFVDGLPGFSAAFAVISSILIIVISKGIGHAFLMKREDYYHPAEGEHSHGRSARHD